jgi:type IV pilus assembly protein PilB
VTINLDYGAPMNDGADNGILPRTVDAVARPLKDVGEAPTAEAVRTLGWRRLGALLLERGLVEPGQLVAAFEEQRESGVRLGDIVVRRGWVTRTELMDALAEQVGLPFVDLGDMVVDTDIAKLLPEHLALRYQALPLQRLDGGQILVGLADANNVNTLDEIRLALGSDVSFALADPVDLELAAKHVHRSNVELEDEVAEPLEADDREDIAEVGSGTPAVKYANAAIARAIDEGASDVHFVPEEDHLAVRVRIDGVVRELMTIPKGLQPGVLSRLKIMGALDIAERREPQDGRVLVRFRGKPVDLRIAVLPTTHGERVVLRVLQRATAQATLVDLGMSPADEAAFLSAIRQPHGAVIVCGPTGSGKTSTLYTALGLLNDPGRVLLTIEDPVEYQIPGVSQIEVNVRSGLTFARGLRTILRSDPDVLLVGEIRDEETARIAVQAAMTGHLVLTSLHTHDSASAIARLKDMGVDPGLLSSSVNCIVAQRLARRLCVECREAYMATPEERALVGLAESTDDLTLWRPTGCSRCRKTGFRGRIALYEFMPIEGKLRMLADLATEEIFAVARAQGMRTLLEDGYRLCVEGICSIDEIHRVTGDRVH